MEKLKEYIENWISIEGLKPCNEELFINEFINLLNTIDDDRDISFDGEGSYFGKQITLHWNSGVWVGDPLINFEIAYSQSSISVYTANNHGFWTPEYLSMTSKDARFDEVKTALFKLLYRVFGLPENINP